jgi:geranylgeranyl pyrophosphate synthase
MIHTMATEPSLALLRQAAAAEVEHLLTAAAAAFPAGSWLRRALTTSGKLLGPSPDEGLIWGLLPLLACQSAGGDPRRALPLAAAVECLIAATDILDDIEDADAPDALYLACGLPTATNVATLLLFLSQAALGRLREHGASAEQIAAAGLTLAEAGARACAGQQHDLTPDLDTLVDTDSYLRMIGLKAGALVDGICRAGALLSPATPATVAAYGAVGLQMGLALQVSNDVVGTTAPSLRADLHAGRRTLPLLIALRQGLPAPDPAALSSEAAERLYHRLTAAGVLDYARVVADICWDRALTALRGATGGVACPMRHLIDRLRGG